jgi:hypothetical protein
VDKVTKGRMPLPQPLGLPDLEVVPAAVADRLLWTLQVIAERVTDSRVSPWDISELAEQMVREVTKE